MSKIALLPGGFKPPHAGHYNMAKWLSANTNADTTIIFVGPKERDGITQAMSLELWKLYTQNDSGLEVRPAGVSPVRDVYDFIEQEAPEGSTVFLGMGEKDVSDTRFKNIPKFAEPKGITFETKLVPPQAGGVSGTEMRGFIKMDDKALFQYSLPEHLSDKQKNEAWDIVTGLKEDLYDPRDKYYDFAKTNDPNPKKPVPNNYKYSRRNFPFRSMYERDLSDKEEKIAQDLPDKEFKKRYGKDWKAVKIATATKMAKNEGDTYEKMAAKGKKKGNLKQGTVRKRLKIKDGEKIPLSKITKAISKIKKMKSPSEKNKKYLKALNLAKTLKTTTHKENVNEADPKKGTGKKPKGSGRRLYTDENPKDTVKVKFSTRQDIVDTLNKASFKSKSHKRQSQVINLIHQRVRAALGRSKDPAVKKRLRSAFEYIKKRKEASKKKTQRMKKESVFSKDWWKTQINEMLSEVKANTHLTHLEELVLTQGQDGFNKAKSFLYELIKNLKGQDNTIKNVSVKWDGAPAIFTGINPDNGQFFVGTKSVFNKEPKINYTPKDIDQNHGHAAGLAKKLKLALQYLPSLGIKNILQGDFMFDNDDVETEDIEGITHYTFKPNTIRYAIEANSELGKKIIAARIGIIFHTTYNDLSGGGASFGANVSGLNKSTNVWFDDAFFKDDTGILLSDEEEKFVLEKINESDSINVDYTNLPLKNLNTYINSEIRQGEFLDDPSKSFERFKNWYQQAVDKSIEKVSRPESKERKRQAGEEKLREFESQKQDIINIFKVSKLLSEAKSIFITKYDKAVATKHFIDNGDGTLSVTKAEGFVAVDHTENGIKLVDRLEFSKNNFNAGKPGAKK